MRRLAPILAFLVSLAVPTGAQAEGLEALVPTALPMAIRDGRVAAITVHAVPFALGAEALEAGATEAMERLAAEAAGPCFLTAQAVGHAQPGTPGEGGDASATQALARARADLVRAALIRGGLAPQAVAAVADYRFTVREPRVTLWLFRAADVAECGAKPPSAVATPPEPTDEPRAASPPAAKPAPRAAAPEPAGGPPVAAAEILFESGSSFFPSGAERELERLVAALPAAPGYRIDVLAGVDDAPVKPGDPALSARYNRWLAERRLERVGEWLEQRAEIRDLEVRRAVAEDDRSPRVAVRARPAAR